MTDTVLVTGASGTLGHAVVQRLPTGTHVRALSRKQHTDTDSNVAWFTGDLRSGAGLDDAVSGADVIVHCASTKGRGDVEATRNLVAAAERAGTPHLIYISIVGIEHIPMFYYRAKLEAERLIEASSLPWTILRATQFHDLIATMTSVQRRLPAVLLPKDVRFQPIDVGEVADRLVELAGGAASGRVPDIGGPEIRDGRDLALAALQSDGLRKPVLAVPLGGKVMRGYRSGAHLTPEHPVGRITFDEFLTQRTS